MIATLNQSRADLPRLVELASQGEDVLITVDGLPRAKLTRAEGTDLPSIPKLVDVSAWLSELEDLRRSHSIPAEPADGGKNSGGGPSRPAVSYALLGEVRQCLPQRFLVNRLNVISLP